MSCFYMKTSKNTLGSYIIIPLKVSKDLYDLNKIFCLLREDAFFREVVYTCVFQTE